MLDPAVAATPSDPRAARVNSARLQWCSEVDRGAVGMGQASVLVKAPVRCSRFVIQVGLPAAVRALASRSLSMLTWSLSIPVRTLRATASRSAMSGEASE